ncbi:MAG: hypothetical protein GXY15_01075 [Candidatus Hydrogenedentes bacterium]|nr:hypothetical protein [Candidatus Hydrogenedentota bacterium]
MNTPDITTVVERLYARTSSGDLKWEQTEQEGVYQTSFPNYSIRLSEEYPVEAGDEPMDYWIRIYNSDGMLVTSFCDRDVFEDFKKKGSNAYHVMRKMYIMSRDQSMGVTRALNDILDCLSDGDAQ